MTFLNSDTHMFKIRSIEMKSKQWICWKLFWILNITKILWEITKKWENVQWFRSTT